MSEHFPLAPEVLRLTIDLQEIDYSLTTKSQPPILGQIRAQSALEFGVSMQNSGYNIYVMGEPGTGRLSMITSHLDDQAQHHVAPPSFAYVDNFENLREPVAIELPAGVGAKFSKDIDKLIDNLLATFPAVFESPTYQQKKSAIERAFNQKYNAALSLVENRAQEAGIAVYRESETITFLPVRDNKSLDEDQFTQLPQEEREAFKAQVEILENFLSDVLLELPQWRRAMVKDIRELDDLTITQAITPLFKELKKQYQNIDDVITYLAEIKKDLRNSIAIELANLPFMDSRDNQTKRQLLVERYAPNILIDYKQGSGAPVIYEPHPIYQNLFGRIEYQNEQGTLVTNYRRICPGSLHKANGGYLILDADKLLNYPFVWEGLKRALKSGKIEIESPYSELGINTMTLKPEVIPLNIKVILVGSRDIYYLLQELDDEFNEMFRILADFDDHIKITPLSIQQFATLMVKQAADSGAKPLTRCAIERLIEHSCRQAEHQRRLSAHINDSLEIIGEANLLSTQAAVDVIDKQFVEKALAAREHRNGRISEAILEEMLDGTILIDTEGGAIGKVNGLTVLEIGGSSFGAPARITTTVYPGSRGIVDIEREVELGQALHSKGVMILTGYLGHCYAQQFPLAISASIAIEQSYGYIDGDSASLAELCSLISALTLTPIKQTFAVTGSINQYGEVQAIGGVNEKIEGFFRLCQARGLNGEQGVIVPKANQRNLMLMKEVVDAVAQGLFSVYTVSNVDETLEILTGQPAGAIDEEGNYPENSVNYKAILRLKAISDMTNEEDKEEGG
ncbi:Lon protease family protein [Methylicorpusculum sp.]|uniref:Lon protease family protein n=1 Tax=Methylicorpusculum sp. TaxID=2713644 RepID=UPI0027214E58|nr:ATP-binding protein [Methylicorpusculum sp.]MDO8844385.1 ATP-binding protein [Methylicorpusculum sp.]MDP2176903.1 ATP-binding protein [Methylicorpusculum sp.]MDP3529903.1 ATP-binding protein [Methylicorpusculum sp.]MDZ4154058.1 ATP-binding protein [Methylicorpusculum sp.]